MEGGVTSAETVSNAAVEFVAPSQFEMAQKYDAPWSSSVTGPIDTTLFVAPGIAAPFLNH